MLKISIRTLACWSAQSLSTRPGILLGPTALQGLTLESVPVDFLAGSVQCFKLCIGGVKCIWKDGISLSVCGMWWNLVVHDGLDTLPHTPCILLLKWLEIFFCMIFMIVLCQLEATGQVCSHCTYRCLVSCSKCGVPGFHLFGTCDHGLSDCDIINAHANVASHCLCIFTYISEMTGSCFFEDTPVCAVKTILESRSGSLCPLICLVSGLACLKHGLYGQGGFVGVLFICVNQVQCVCSFGCKVNNLE